MGLMILPINKLLLHFIQQLMILPIKKLLLHFIQQLMILPINKLLLHFIQQLIILPISKLLLKIKICNNRILPKLKKTSNQKNQFQKTMTLLLLTLWYQINISSRTLKTIIYTLYKNLCFLEIFKNQCKEKEKKKKNNLQKTNFQSI